MEKIYLSNCCNAEVKVYSSEEGTNSWECTKCGKTCDAHLKEGTVPAIKGMTFDRKNQLLNDFGTFIGVLDKVLNGLANILIEFKLEMLSAEKIKLEGEIVKLDKNSPEFKEMDEKLGALIERIKTLLR